MVSFPGVLQILALLADALIEIQEQVLADEEEVFIVLTSRPLSVMMVIT